MDWYYTILHGASVARIIMYYYVVTWWESTGDLRFRGICSGMCNNSILVRGLLNANLLKHNPLMDDLIKDKNYFQGTPAAHGLACFYRRIQAVSKRFNCSICRWCDALQPNNRISSVIEWRLNWCANNSMTWNLIKTKAMLPSADPELEQQTAYFSPW